MKKYGMGSIPAQKSEVLDKSGSVTEGYIDKKGTPSGQNAAFNYLPPGQDINNQCNADLRDLPMKSPTLTGNNAYTNDGWEGSIGSESKKTNKADHKSIDLPLAGGDKSY